MMIEITGWGMFWAGLFLCIAIGMILDVIKTAIKGRTLRKTLGDLTKNGAHLCKIPKDEVPDLLKKIKKFEVDLDDLDKDDDDEDEDDADD